MKDFKSGICNTLIATCVAEEGIDVGEVDLIVCFDVNNKNTTRYIQRIGRTGRKRQGKVIMLVSEGKEQSILREVMATKDGTNQKISKSSEVTKALYRDSPRMVPPTFHPQCVETCIKIDNEETPVVELSTNSGPSTSKAKRPKTNKRVQPTRGTKQPDIRKALAKRVELDDEILRDFDVPDTLNTSKMSRGIHEQTMSDPSLPPDMSMQCSDGGDISIKDKFLKICERYREIKKCPNVETKPLDAAAVINNDKLAKPLKLLWLKNNLDSVRQHYNCQKTSRLYASIAKIIGDDQAVHRLVMAPNEQWSNMKPMRQMSIFQMLNLVDREEKENLPENGPVDSSDEVRLTLESQQSFGFVESKYASQFESQLLGLRQPASHNDAISSSTPKRLNKTAASNVQTPIDSPIKRTQFTSTYKRTRATNKKEIPDTVPHYLRFLGLRSIDDLFSDSDGDDNANPLPNVVETDKTDANSNNIPVNEMVESDLFADESVAFTSASPSITTATTTTPTTKRVNKLNVGSISDLFRDDDFDDDDDNDAVAMGETSSKTGSDDTEEYDFEEIISIMEIAEAAAVPREKENQNGNQEVKVVVQQKSDDLFATYNDTIDTNANRSSANGTNFSHFSVPTPPKASATKKDSAVSADSQQSPSGRLNYAIIQDKSPSVLNRSSQSRSHSGASSKSLLSKFNATVQSSDAQSDVNRSLRFGSPSTSGQPKKLNLARLKANAAAPLDNISQETAFSQFLTCREATTSAQDAVTVNKSQIDQMNMNISTESETPDEDEIFATCQMVDDKNSFMISLLSMVGPNCIWNFPDETSAATAS